MDREEMEFWQRLKDLEMDVEELRRQLNEIKEDSERKLEEHTEDYVHKEIDTPKEMKE